MCVYQRKKKRCFGKMGRDRIDDPLIPQKGIRESMRNPRLLSKISGKPLQILWIILQFLDFFFFVSSSLPFFFVLLFLVPLSPVLNKLMIVVFIGSWQVLVILRVCPCSTFLTLFDPLDIFVFFLSPENDWLSICRWFCFVLAEIKKKRKL